MTITEFLKDHVPFLAGLDQAQAKELAQAVEQEDYAAGRLLVMQGETVDQLYVIATGKVSVSRKEKGAAAKVLAELGPGDVFGETSIVEMGVAGASVRAAEDTHVFKIPQAAFIGAMDRNPALKDGLLKKIAARRAKP